MLDRVSSVARHVTEVVPRLLVDQGLPGLAVGVGDRSGVLWSAGFGTTVRGDDRPVTTRTLFNLMSGSKMYTATTVLLAVQEGLLDLDEPIVSYLPELTVRSTWEPHPERRLTLRVLLSHRSGLTHEAPRGSNFDSSDLSFDDHCRSIADTWLRFPVGHHVEYGNLALDLAAWTVERVTGRRFADQVHDVLLRPLGLERTTFDHEQIVRDADRAVGHSEYPTPPPVRVPMVGGAGAYAGVDDVLSYVAFHLSGGAGVLDPALLDQMYDVPGRLPGQRLGFGLGVATSDWGGRTVRGHSGGGFGFLCDIGWDPAAGLGVAVLVSSDDHPLRATLATEILQLLGPVAPARPARRRDVGPAPAVAHGPTDEYVGPGGQTLHVAVPEGRTSLERDGETFVLVGRDGASGRDYLVRAVDGVAFYRNPSVAVQGRQERFAIDYLGSHVTTLVLRRGPGGATLGASGYFTFPPLSLTELAPGLWSSAVGEVLDLSTSPPTYANIPLRRLEPG